MKGGRKAGNARNEGDEESSGIKQFGDIEWHGKPGIDVVESRAEGGGRAGDASDGYAQEGVWVGPTWHRHTGTKGCGSPRKS